MLAVQIEVGRGAVDLERGAGLDRGGVYRVVVERIARPSSHEPIRRVGDYRHERVANRARCSGPSALAVLLRRVVERREDDIERSRTASGKSSRPSGRMSTSTPCRMVMRGYLLANGAMSSRWRSRSPRRKGAGGAGALRVVGDRDVFVAERRAFRHHRLERVGAVAVHGVHVQVAANVLALDEHGKCAGRGGFDFAGVFAELGWDEG